MKALVCKQFGPIEDVELQELPSPEPGPGQVLVDVRAAGVNFPDLLAVQGKYQIRSEPPFTPGAELSGVIAQLGEGVEGFSVGDEVIGIFAGGAFAEQCVVDATNLFRKPASISFEQAAGLSITYGTSYYALKQLAKIQPGETILVLGAAGGVGTSAVQLASAMGARVIAAASTAEKLEFATRAGADEVINYSDEDLRDRIKELTDGKGVDVIYDPVGGDLSETAFRSIAWGGRFLVIGFAAGTIPKLPLNLPLLKCASVIGVFWGSWIRKFPEEGAANVEELAEMIASGRLDLLVTEVYPLDDYLDAFRAIDERRARGKVILSMSGA
ncbi:MAG: NADPH:quinone oxidoreductase family protein [Woeseiaceae bacterium]